MKESMMDSLLLLFARECESITEELKRRLRNITIYAICIDNLDFSTHSIFQSPSKSRLQIVFFSPGFLNFLEFRPEEAFLAFKFMDPLSTLAVFCCGLQEEQIKCYHMAPLNSYNSWPKYEIGSRSENEIDLPQQFIRSLQEMFPNKDSSAESILIFPELISPRCSTVVIIFPKVVQEVGAFSVYLEGDELIEVTTKDVNPYVVRFRVPEFLIDNYQTIGVKILQSNDILTEKALYVVKYNRDVSQKKAFREDYPQKTSREDYPLKKASREEVSLHEQLQYLHDFTRSAAKSYEDKPPIQENSITQFLNDDEVTQSLAILCQKYGLEELSCFINETETPTNSIIEGKRDSPEVKELPPMNQERRRRNADVNIYEGNKVLQILNENFDTLSQKHSLSMPSLLSTSDFNGEYERYIRMGDIGRMERSLSPASEIKPEDNDTLNSFSTHNYVTMRWNRDSVDFHEILKRNENQELLETILAFKRGENTLYDVEEQYQKWHMKHQRSEDSVTSEKTRKISSSFLSDWKNIIQRKSCRKTSKGSEVEKRASIMESLKSSQTNSRKTSNASGSSISSKTSENSSMSCSKSFSKETVSTGWIPTSSTFPICPLSPQTQPPPLPPKPLSMCSTMRRKEFSASRHAASQPLAIPHSSREPFEPEYMNNDQLMEFCEEHGIADLDPNLLDEFISISAKHHGYNLGSSKDESWSDNNLVSKYVFNVPDEDWDKENTHRIIRRSLSLPSTFCPMETLKVPGVELKLGDKHHIEDGNASHDFTNYSAEDCLLSSITSNIYMSIKSQVDLPQNQPLKKSNLSNSQQELLELMNAFKRGEKTISQVENQFQEWHQRHVGKSSHREEELMLLKDEYVKARKRSSFGLKSFILGKPRKNSKAENEKSVIKRRTRKSETDSKRLSKTSVTSTSSGISDSSEMNRAFCYFNPDYGNFERGTVSDKTSNSHKDPASSSVKKPPPLPPRPPFFPSATLQSYDQKTNVPAAEDAIINPSNSSALNNAPRKSSLPSKMHKVLGRDNCGMIVQKSKSEAIEISQVDKAEPEAEPASPDYITPNEAKFFPPGKRRKRNDNLTQPNWSAANLRVDNNAKELPSAHTLLKGDSLKGEPSGSNKTGSQKGQLFKFAKLVMKDKRKDESMFYVTVRRCSSFPDLKSSKPIADPIYLQLLNPETHMTKSTSNDDNYKNN